jgi:protein-tyrosine sulfotransferase
MSPADGPRSGFPDPVFILTASRSGSTLLRFILDTHPDLACPPESGIAAACSSIARFRGVIDGTSAMVGSGLGGLSADAEQDMLSFFDATYQRYLEKRGKKRWCDKSLDNVLHADLLANLWPNSQFICLVRHCMDVISSGVEACAWGLSGFGFDSCSAMYPGNSVAAIGAYWAQTVTAMLEFAKEYPERCRLVRYEDLVDNPENIASGIFEFLGERHVPGITARCLSAPHETTGPGDEKIWFTSRVSDESVGRGVRVPAEKLPPPLREHINGLLGVLEYQPVNQYWNSAVGPIDPRLAESASGQAQWPCVR